MKEFLVDKRRQFHILLRRINMMKHESGVVGIVSALLATASSFFNELDL